MKKIIINKKSLSQIIAVMLILLLTVTTGTITYNWYNGFMQDIQTKKLQSINANIDESIKFLGFENESSSYNLYLRSNVKGYIIINELKLNNNNCTILNTNVLLGYSTTILNISCPIYSQINQINIITDFGIANSNLKLG